MGISILVPSLKEPGEVLRLFSNGRNPHFCLVGRGGDGLSSPLETPCGLMTLPGPSASALATECLPKGECSAVHAHFFTFFQDQIPLEIFTINLFSS